MTIHEDTRYLLQPHTEVLVEWASSNGTQTRDVRISGGEIIQAAGIGRVDDPKGDLKVHLTGKETYVIDWKDVKKFQVFVCQPMFDF